MLRSCPVLSGGASLCRDYPQATGSYWLVSLDAERHIADLKKIAATMHQDDRKRMFAAAKLTVRAPLDGGSGPLVDARRVRGGADRRWRAHVADRRRERARWRVRLHGRHRLVAVGGAAHDGAGPTGAHRRGRLSPPATPPSGFMNP